MIKGLLSLMNVAESEEKPVLLLLGYGFFMGVSLAILKIVATTLFLNDPELVVNLREAFFVSGILGVVSTMLYAYFQKKVKFSTLLTCMVISIFLFIALARYYYSFPEYNSQIKYILFVMLGPITSLMILGFYGIFYRLFDLGQTKRIISRIDTGHMIAFIMATYAIPLLTGIIYDITDFLIIAEVSLIISLIFIIVIISSNKLDYKDTQRALKQKQGSYRSLIKEPYVISLALFIFFSMLATTFMDYSFWNVTEQQYPDEKQLASFLGVFEGTVMVIGLLLQTFANDFLIRNFSLKVSLLLLPLVLLMFTAAALFSGYYFGFTLPNEYFIWFFLFITLSNLFTKTLREATESPIFKLFFMPLDKHIRFDAQAKIEGIFVEMARAIGGGLILLFGLIPMFELIHYSWIMVLIIGFWVYMAILIHRQYKQKIEDVLEQDKDGTDHLSWKQRSLIERILAIMRVGTIDARIFGLKVLSKIDVREFVLQAGMIKNSSEPDDHFVMQIIENDLPYLLADEEDEEGEPSVLKEGNGKKDYLKLIQKYKESSNPDDRIKLARVIAGSEREEGVNILFDLINDQNAKVVKTTLVAAGRLKRKEFLPFLLENLKNTDHRDAASEALIYFGHKSLPALDELFNNTDMDLSVQLSIIQIYGKIGANIVGEEFGWEGRMQTVRRYLMAKMNYPNKRIVSETLKVLGGLEMKIDREMTPFIIKVLDDELDNLIWNARVVRILQDEDDDKYWDIIDAVKDDVVSGYDHLYLLLTIIFSYRSIKLIRNNVESDSTENIAYAMELIDVLFEEYKLSNELKQKVNAVLANAAKSDSSHRLYSSFYQGATLSVKDIIRQLVNRDLDLTNRWTKACALYLIGIEKLDEYKRELVANLYNPDELLSEVAAHSVHILDDELLKVTMKSLGKSAQEHILNLIVGQQYANFSILRPHMKFELVKFLKNSTNLSILPNHHLINLADNMHEKYIEKNSEGIMDILNEDTLCFVFEGNISIKEKETLKKQFFVKGDMLKERNCTEVKNNLLGTEILEDTVILSVDKDKFYDLIVFKDKYFSEILKSFESQVQKEKIELPTDVKHDIL